MIYLLQSSACREPRALLLLVLPCQPGAGGALGAGKECSPDSDPDWPKRCPPEHVVMLSKWKAERIRKRRAFIAMAFVFPRKHYVCWALLAWEWLYTCLPVGSNKWIPSLHLLVHAAFNVLSKLSLSQLMSSCTLTITILSLTPPGEHEQEVVWCWAALTGLNLYSGEWKEGWRQLWQIPGVTFNWAQLAIMLFKLFAASGHLERPRRQ